MNAIRDTVADQPVRPQKAATVGIDGKASQIAAARSLACELPRDRDRKQTVADVIQIVLDGRLLKESAR